MRDRRIPHLPKPARNLLRWHVGLEKSSVSLTFDDLPELARHGLMPVAHRALQEDAAFASEQVASRLTQMSEKAQHSAVGLEARAVWVSDLFERAGLEFRALKGLATASLDHPRRVDRVFKDLDLLVRPHELGVAAEVLTQAGLTRSRTEPFPGYDLRYSKGVTMAFEDGVEVDLHRTFVVGAFGLRIPLHELWQESASFSLGGRELRALVARHRVANALLHFALSPTVRAAELLDIRLLMNVPTVHTQDVIEMFERWRCDCAAVAGISLATTFLGSDWLPEELVDWAGSCRVSLVDCWLAESHFGPRASSARRTVGAIVPLQWHDRWRYFSGYLLAKAGRAN